MLDGLGMAVLALALSLAAALAIFRFEAGMPQTLAACSAGGGRALSVGRHPYRRRALIVRP